jgi:hypothetical protein
MQMWRSKGGFLRLPLFLGALVLGALVLGALTISSGCGGCEGTTTATNNEQTEQDTGWCIEGDCPDDAGDAPVDTSPGPNDSDITPVPDADEDTGEACAAEDICGSECCASAELWLEHLTADTTHDRVLRQRGAVPSRHLRLPGRQLHPQPRLHRRRDLRADPRQVHPRSGHHLRVAPAFAGLRPSGHPRLAG